MPTSSNDSLAVLVLLVFLMAGGILVAFGAQRFSDSQRTTLSSRSRVNLLSLMSAAPLLVAYYYAPLIPAWAVAIAAASILLAAPILVRYHARQGYTRAIRAFLIVGFTLQFAGAIFAVVLRATGDSR